jgi:hypothetical protein
MSRISPIAAVLLLVLGIGAAVHHRVPALAAQSPAVVADVAPSAPSDWPAFHGGGPLTGVAAPMPGGAELKVRWVYDCSEDGKASVEGGAAIVGDTVYVADTESSLHAIDLKTGKRKWAYKAQNGFVTTPLVRFDAKRNDGVVFLGDEGGIFHAVAAKDGSKVWTFETTSTIHASATPPTGSASSSATTRPRFTVSPPGTARNCGRPPPGTGSTPRRPWRTGGADLGVRREAAGLAITTVRSGSPSTWVPSPVHPLR